MDYDFKLNQAQGVKLMCLVVLLKDGDLELFGEDAAEARSALLDMGEEIALQAGGYPA